MTPFEQITAIIDAAIFPERPEIPARVSAPKNQTGGRQAAPDDLASEEGEKIDTETSVTTAPAAPAVASESAGEKNIPASAAPPADAASASDESAEFAEPCASGIGGENSAEALARPPKKRRRKRGGDDDDEGQDGAARELFKPRKFGFDVDELNKEYALVLLGSKAVIFRDQPNAPLEDKQRLMSPKEGFGLMYANRFTERRDPKSGEVKAVTWAQAWMQSPDRREYWGVEFHPDPDNAQGTKDYLNLWSGFAVEPAATDAPATYKTFRDHLLNNVCDGDEKLYAWVFGFFAQIVQRPREVLGVSLVMRGPQGVGKTKVGQVMGSLYPRHYFLVDDPRYVTGQFNAHMASCLLLQADEAVWAGDKKAEGKLKGLITAPFQMIERKNIDAVRLTNYARLIQTSNEDWVVPAGKDERRSCVLDINPRCSQNHDYFREMDEELAAGGLAVLLRDLLAFDLASVNLRQIPRTDALLEQKIHSLDSIDGWWLERLMAGTATRRASVWVKEIACQTLFDDYILHSERIGVKRKQIETVLGIKLKKLWPGGLRKAKRDAEVVERSEVDGSFHNVTKRTWCYLLPSLEDSRAHFEALVGQKVAWPVEVDDSKPADREVEHAF